MRILFIGDYSNLHACIASRLRKEGHDVTVVSDRCGYMNTHSDIFLSRGEGLTGGISYLFRLFSLLPSFSNYDVVQLINPNFLHLRPGKIKYFFDRLKGENGKICLTLAGNDYYFVKACADAKIFRFSEFKVGDKPTEFLNSTPQRMYGWLSETNRKWNEYLYSRIDAGMAVLPEYEMAAREILGDRLFFTNLPIDLDEVRYSPFSSVSPVCLLVGMRGGMEIQKGTARLLSMAKDIQKEFPGKFEAVVARNLSLEDYLEVMRGSHIVLDQLYSYSPATNALQAMAMGRIAVSGAQPEYLQALGNPDDCPVISASPLDDDLKDRIVAVAENPSRLWEMGQLGRRFVEKYNSSQLVASRFLDIWRK